MIRLAFLITVITYFLFVACHSSDQEKIHQENLSLQNEVMLDFMKREYEALKRRTEKLLNDPAHYPFLPILSATEKVDYETQKILNQIDQIKTANSHGNQVNQQVELFAIVVDSSLNKITNIHSNLLHQYGGRPFGLKEDEVEKLLFEFENDIKVSFNDWNGNNLSLLGSSYGKQAMGNLEWKIRLMQFELYQYFTMFYRSSCAIRNWDYYPVVIPEKYIVKTDEAFKAKVSIGTYITIDPSYIKLFVNGDSIEIDDDGIAELSIPSKDKIGIQNLDLEAIIRDPDNGQIHSVDGSFEYEVIEK